MKLKTKINQIRLKLQREDYYMSVGTNWLMLANIILLGFFRIGQLVTVYVRN